MRSKAFTACLLSLAVAAATSPALADTANADIETRPADQLAPVTIVSTAAGFDQKLTDAPASVTIVDREALASRPYTSLADALRDVEGIDVGTGTDKNGNLSITMRGLPAEYTLILIDGRRQSNIGNIYPNGFGGGQFSFMPPLDAIERIEVVRGPMSTLYGSDAMGGVINIITRKVSDTWAGSITHGRTLQEHAEFGDDIKTDIYITGPLIKDKLGIVLRGGIYNREESNPRFNDTLLLSDGTPWENSGGFGSDTVAAQNWTGGVRLAFTPTENHDILLDYDVSKQRYDNRQGQTGTLDGTESLWRSTVVSDGPNAGNRVVAPRVGYTEFQRYEREQLTLTHIGRWDIGTSEIALTRSESNNLGRSQPLSIQERDTLQQLWCDVGARLEPGAPDPCQLNLGNRLDELDDDELERLNAFLPRPLRELKLDNTIVDAKLDTMLGNHLLVVGGQYIDSQMEDGVFGLDGAGFQQGTIQPHRQWALFFEDNWDLLPQLTLTAGLRYDDHNIFGDQLSPRGYLVWRTSPAWTLKGGASTGYKAPTPDQLYPGITGFTGQGVNPTVGNPSLTPETSTNYEVAAYFDNGGRVSANLTVFRSDFDDKISTGDSVPNCEVNNVPGCVDIGPGWADLGYIQFRQSTNVDKALTQGAEVATRIRIANPFALRANYTYTDSEQRSGNQKGLPLVNTPEHMANAYLDWFATQDLTVTLGAEARSKRYRGVANASGPQGQQLLEYYKSYELFHLGARYQVNEDLTFNARINNLLDTNFVDRTCVPDNPANISSYTCNDNYRIQEYGRSLWLSANMRF
ncbi:TonB-dependent receptor [Alcanivorax sp. JB21]|uniref:TonB-dependent receptor domain-containing protein n=1 Tax=Alcanivorax limicola TaxID=2874102 RepID=UPI001CBBC54A|nr:TonB-dependent receptor [Alcanivorax limicola]MBZ2189810.1 TonB-dependent receptor [Alcanivorax limicola]